MTQTVSKQRGRQGSRRDPQELWYAPDPKIETDNAAEQATRIVDSIARGGEDYDEVALFTTLHTCAYRSMKALRKGDHDEAELWHDRWSKTREHLVEKNLGLVHLMIKR